MINFFLYILLHLFVNIILKKKNLLIDQKIISIHKRKVKTNIKTPLSGGLVFLIIFFSIFLEQNYILLLGIGFLYLVGLLSDINILQSPIKRIFLQTIVIVLFIIINDLSVKSISIDYINLLLEIKILNIFFVLFCLLILINGFNFLDGINTLVTGYFIICLGFLLYVAKKNQLNLDFDLIQLSILILSIIYLFNFFGKSFLGDSGSYSISFFIGIICIKFAYDNSTLVSPYFIVFLLWYPALENLFSITRRVFFNKRLSVADSNHLHHLIYFYINNKIKNRNSIFANTLTGFLINLYIIINSIVVVNYFNNTKILCSAIILNIIVYVVLYLLLYKIIKIENANK